MRFDSFNEQGFCKLPKNNDKELNLNLKSCVIIVTYNKIPDLQQINNALVSGDIDGLIVVDNSNRKDLIDGIKQQFLDDISFKYTLIENGDNLGISKAINKGLANSLKKGYDYIYLLDDDAKISKDHFTKLRNEYERLVNSGEKVGIVCPIVSNDNSIMNKRIGHEHITKIDAAITSGMLISRHTIELVGMYDESYFLEWADVQFCKRVRKNGLKIFRINEVLVCQDFGNTIKDVKLSFLPLLIYTKTYKLILFKIGIGNDLFSYISIYRPERQENINVYGIRIIMREDNHRYVFKIFRYISFVFTTLLVEVLLFFATGDILYIKLNGVI